jgi:CheY-like chemotaxis protein
MITLAIATGLLMQEETQRIPENSVLTADNLLTLFAALDPLTNSSERKFAAQLLESINALPGLHSTNLLFVNSSGDACCAIWQALDGGTEFGDWQPLAQSPWAARFADEESLWFEGDPCTSESPAPPLEAPFADRCVLTLRSAKQPLALLILHSLQSDLFATWDRSLLRLLIQQCSALFQGMRTLHDLNSQITHYQQRALLHPPALAGIQQLGLAVLNESQPPLAYVRLNLESLQSSLQHLYGALDFFLDEIRLSASPEACERALSYAKRKDLDALRGDLDDLIRDTQEGLLQQQGFFQLLQTLQQHNHAPETLQISELITPLLPFAFAGLDHLTLHTDWQTKSMIYAPKYRMLQGFLMLLFSLQRQLRRFPQHKLNLFFRTERKDSQILLQINYKLPENCSLDSFGDEYLFARHIIEEVQGSFFLNLRDEQCTLNLWFPLMFSSEETEALERPLMTPADHHGAFELPALSHLNIETTGISGEISRPPSHDEAPASPYAAAPSGANLSIAPPKPYQPPQRDRFKIILFGQDQRYLHALRRNLSPPHTLFVARTLTEASDILEAHSDIDLVLCDLHQNPQQSLELYAHVKGQNPLFNDKILFLTDIHHDPHTQEFLRQMSARALSRYLSADEFEAQLRSKVGLLRHTH